MTSQILQPVAVLIAWSLVMWLWLYATRLPAMKRGGLLDEVKVGGTGATLGPKLPANVQWKADNYNHLMEQPTLFYAVALTLAFAGRGDIWVNVALAWAYVVLRIIHSLVQATVNRVPLRFALHALGTLPLIGLATHALFSVF